MCSLPSTRHSAVTNFSVKFYTRIIGDVRRYTLHLVLYLIECDNFEERYFQKQ